MAKTNNSSEKKCYTESEIGAYLASFKALVMAGKYTISLNPNRQENLDFIRNYNIDTAKRKDILLALEAEDFCDVVENIKEEYAHEKLYIFGKTFNLEKWGDSEEVDIYIKINLIQKRNGEDFAIVISFHQRNYEMVYYFK